MNTVRNKRNIGKIIKAPKLETKKEEEKQEKVEDNEEKVEEIEETEEKKGEIRGSVFTNELKDIDAEEEIKPINIIKESPRPTDQERGTNMRKIMGDDDIDIDIGDD